MTTCPRCGDELSPGQEYCVECGLRLPGDGPVGFRPDPGGRWMGRSLVGLVAALAGGALAVAATGGSDTTRLVTATGGFASTPTGSLETPSEITGNRIVDWPVGQVGWTIALVSLPQTGGKKAAIVRARGARKRGIAPVGILDSSRYASLHPGYWIVFSGVFSSEAEATSALRPARAFAKTASVRRIVP